MAENSLDPNGSAKGLAAMLVIVIVFALLILPSIGRREPEPSIAEQQGTASSADIDKIASAKSGRDLYVQHCAACHGGNGRGVAAAYLFPKPRDLRAGRFRLVSTANNVPTPEDLDAM